MNGEGCSNTTKQRACPLMCLAAVKSHKITRACSTHRGCTLRGHLCVTCDAARPSKDMDHPLKESRYPEVFTPSTLAEFGHESTWGMLTGARHIDFAERGALDVFLLIRLATPRKWWHDIILHIPECSTFALACHWPRDHASPAYAQWAASVPREDVSSTQRMSIIA